MDQMFNSLSGVNFYFDDIMIGGPDLEVCRARTKKVFSILRKNNVKCNLQKCKFYEESLQFLGHCVSVDGVAPNKAKLKAISRMPAPKDLTQLRAFLGAINFYGKFLQNLQSKLHSFHELLRKDTPFNWTGVHQNDFERIKLDILNSPLLVHFDPVKPLVMICDAGPYGVGEVLNVVLNGEERPCHMASSSLSPAEKNYSQLHREALAIVFGVKKYHKFIFGRKVTVITDCRALESLLSNEKNIGTVINSRFLRWIILLQNYDLEIKFRPAKYTHAADALSRLPLSENTNVDDEAIDVSEFLKLFNEESENMVSIDLVQNATARNELFKIIIEYVRNGWPDKKQVPKEINKFFNVRHSLDIEAGCLFYGDRLFIPPVLRANILAHIHKEHIGIVKCKQLARKSVWWPNLDQDIEVSVKECEAGNVCANKKREYPLVSWKQAYYPFERVHLDHFVFDGKYYLIMFDVYSSWLQVDYNSKEDSNCVIMSLRKLCATFGLPTVIVTDNGTAFTSKSFQNFLKANDIIHTTSPPYHPQSNGAAERQVAIVKQNLRKTLVEAKGKCISIEVQLQNFLFKNHNTPLYDNLSPSEKIYVM